MRNRINYGSQSVLVGPSPATGFHFLDYTGCLNDRYNDLGGNHNLLQIINRVQSASYSFGFPATEIRQLGTRGTVARPVINSPTVNLQIEYLLNGLANDARLGFNVNFAQFQYPYSGTPFYSNNFQVNLLSGLMARQFGQPTGDPYWPYPMRDNRNIFLVTSPEGTETSLSRQEFNFPDTTKRVGPFAPNYTVTAFGQCYLDSYETQGGVNSIPRSKVSFSCENVCFYMSGSGCFTPVVNTQTRELIRQNHFNIPEIRDEGGPTVLLPDDILLSITPSGFGDITGLGVNFNDIKIQDYQFRLDFNRDLLTSLGYKHPLDREITFPILGRVGFGFLVGDANSGHFINTLNRNSGYNIKMELRNHLVDDRFCVISGNTAHPKHSGPAYAYGNTAIRYDFLNAKFDSISYEHGIGSNVRANINFLMEINPDDFSNGIFVSGLLNLDKIEDYLIDETGDYLLDENSDVIRTNLMPLY